MRQLFAFLSTISILATMAACTPEENNSNGNGKYKTVHVTGISLDRATATIKEGEFFTLFPSVTPNNADNKNVIWSSSSEAVATVDGSGNVTGVKAGNATITATTEDGGMKATCALSVEANLAPAVTVEANHLSAISAVLAGKVNLGSTVASDLKVGFQYSLSAGILPSNSTTIEATDADANYNYTTSITGLDPATTYYFRSFVRQNGQDTYGETKSFTTKEVASMLETKEASDIEATKATLNAKLDLTDTQYKSLDYGFFWGSSEVALNSDYKCTEIKDTAILATLTNLSHKTQYWYKSYVKLDSQTFYGEVKTFTTDVVPVTKVSLNITRYTFHEIGNTLSLKATVRPSDATDKSVQWSSDMESVATVDQNGIVKAIGNGNTTITVTTKDQKKTASCAITVAQLITSITLVSSSITLNEGQEQSLVATIFPDNAANKTLKWTSSNESVATVDQQGKVTAVSMGTATIMAEANDGSGKCGSCVVRVNRLVSSIELDKTSIIIYNGKTETIAATVTPSSATNTSLSWTSSNSSVAAVSSPGLITGVARGTATITVKADDESGVKATCEVEVKQYITSITLSKTSLWLAVGAHETVLVTSVLPVNANDKTITWSSSDNSVAAIDQNGKVTAKAKGNAVITASTNDGSGVSSSCTVSVCPAGAVDLGLSVYWATCNLSENGFVSSPEAFGDYYAWGETETKSNFSWSTYKWGTSDSSLSKYNTYSSRGIVDYKTVLDSEDDVAQVKLGGNWRMPTVGEWDELRNNCTWTWETNYNGSGVSGKLGTSTNGNSIFLPAAGQQRDDINLNYVGCAGYYWSSSLQWESPSSAWFLWFNLSNIYTANSEFRFPGRSVRPVTK